MTCYIPYKCILCNHEIWKQGMCCHCEAKINAFTIMLIIATIITIILIH